MKTDVRIVFAIVALWTALAAPACAGGALPPVVEKLDSAVAHLQGLPALYGAMLATCAHNEACEAKVRASWLPIIDGMQVLHETYCAAHQNADPGCP